ncbi:hypothetical protein FHS78_002442 [Parvibaculum indicum]|uniref:hypothetical protein n=1 Tax=Parvibaculum indicum TaxID=562969 RepID=UPI001423AF17|nr:hypothetical protein [Parvibaculum indicum]NIJ42149.1 hypothetical protein [Parvibaculum indicum]
MTLRRMTRRLTYVFAALLLSAALAAAPGIARADDGFLSAVDDMPLMPGLAETGDGGIAFDKPTGRIVRAVATGDVSEKGVRAFYNGTLPQLGWEREKKLELIGDLMVFRREGERLEIQIVPEGTAHTEVRFSIEPD